MCRPASLSGLALLALWAAPAMAQEAPPPDPAAEGYELTPGEGDPATEEAVPPTDPLAEPGLPPEDPPADTQRRYGIESTLTVPEDDGPRLAVFGALDKITARVERLEIPVGETARFGSLSVSVRFCSKRPPEEPPEVTAFVQVEKLGGRADGSDASAPPQAGDPAPATGAARLRTSAPAERAFTPSGFAAELPAPPEGLAFSGWMFASSPGLSALEDPVYDIWLIDCRPIEG